MEAILLTLVKRLQFIGERSEEPYDTVVQDEMGCAIFRGFLRPEPGYELPDDFGLYSPEANRAVREALEVYITAARDLARAKGLTNFHERLAALQNVNVMTEDGGTYDEFFGYHQPRMYDPEGNWLGPRS